MFRLNQENWKSDIHSMISNALERFLGFISEGTHYERVEIGKLVEDLEKLPNVEGVRVVRNKNNSSHEVVFELLSHVNPDSRTKLLKTAISLAIKTERKLDTISNVEDWDIGVIIVKKFEDINKNQKVVLTNVRPEYLRATS